MSCGSVGRVCSCTVGEFLGDALSRAARGRGPPRARGGSCCLRGEAAGALAWREFLARGDAVPEARALARAEAVAPDALSDLLFTSGTTGEPKGVMTTHAPEPARLRGLERGGGAARGRPLPGGEPVLPLLRLQGGLAGQPDARRDRAAARGLRRARRARARGQGAGLGAAGPADAVSVDPRAPGPRPLRPLGAAPRGDGRGGDPGRADPPHAPRARLRDRSSPATASPSAAGSSRCAATTTTPETIATTSGRAIPDTEVRCVDRERQGGAARRAGRGGGARLPRDARLLRGRGRDAQDDRRRTAGCTPATSR